MLVGDRERNCARAGADVEHPRLVTPAEERKRALDDDLRLRPRNERAPVNPEREPAEPPLPEHVREGLAALAAGDEPREVALLLARERRVDEANRRPAHADDVRDEELRVHQRRVDTCRGKPPCCALDGRPGPQAASSRRRLRSSSVRASVNSRSPPSRTWSSW